MPLVARAVSSSSKLTSCVANRSQAIALPIVRQSGCMTIREQSVPLRQDDSAYRIDVYCLMSWLMGCWMSLRLLYDQTVPSGDTK